MKTQKQRHFTPVTTVKSIIGNSTKNYQWMLSPLGELSGNSSIFLQFHSVESKSESPLSRVQLCDPMDCSPPGESTGFSRPEYWMWVPYPFSRGSSWPRDRTQVSHTVGGFFTIWATGEAISQSCIKLIFLYDDLLVCFNVVLFSSSLIKTVRTFD